jgi:hypothetical protein
MTTRKMISRTRINRTVSLALAILSLTFLTTAAHASCFEHAQGASPAIPSALMARTSTLPTAAHRTIVGLWDVTYTTSDNQPLQESYDMWHSDGTELETANVSPIVGNFCIGVWKKVGSEIHLHHVGWGFDNVGNLLGTFTVDDVIVLGDDGNSYTGSFDFKQYDTNGSLLQEVTGTVSATRIGVN